MLVEVKKMDFSQKKKKIPIALKQNILVPI
jgi:hypothetical protein